MSAPASYETLNVTVDGGVAVVTLARPRRRNALDRRMHEELLDALAELTDSDVRVMILTGDDQAFCAGMDVVEAQGSAAPAGDPTDPATSIFRRLETAPIPTIAAIEGHCLGAGLELAICCDVRVASETASLGLPEVKLGIPPAGAIARLARLVGPARAKELVLTGEPVDAARAHGWGLVSRVCPAGQALPAARDMATRMAALAPLALHAGKSLVDDTYGLGVEQAVALEFERAGPVLMSEDAREGMRAFVDGREPTFLGR